MIIRQKLNPPTDLLLFTENFTKIEKLIVPMQAAWRDMGFPGRPTFTDFRTSIATYVSNYITFPRNKPKIKSIILKNHLYFSRQGILCHQVTGSTFQRPCVMTRGQQTNSTRSTAPRQSWLGSVRISRQPSSHHVRRYMTPPNLPSSPCQNHQVMVLRRKRTARLPPRLPVLRPVLCRPHQHPVRPLDQQALITLLRATLTTLLTASLTKLLRASLTKLLRASLTKLLRASLTKLLRASLTKLLRACLTKLLNTLRRATLHMNHVEGPNNPEERDHCLPTR
jgi:hypothetical protein